MTDNATANMQIDNQEEAELTWDEPPVRGTGPTRRSGHTLTVVGEQCFLFGGCDDQPPPGPNNEVHVLRVSGDMKWDKNDISGKPPAPRWRHSADVYDKTKIIYFGGYASNTARFNDVWLLDAKLKTWSCLHPGGSDRKSKRGEAGSAEVIPQPRGSHSGTVIGSRLYVFGGYGGAGYSRRDFNDLHSFDIEERRWEKVSPKGTPPQPRAGHVAVAVEDKVLVFGGTSSTEQFNDLHVFEPATETWTATDCNYGTPRWNAALVAVAAVPHWQVFLFGGAVGDFSESARGMQFDNSVTVLDTGRMRWNTPKVLGDPPCGRSDTPAVYDAKRGRLIVFGGWANRWYSDLYTLDVQSMVGPPYAILDMNPKLGANTGGQDVVIKGMGFQDTGPINVQFSTRRHVQEVSGTFVDSGTITCQTPEFTRLGPAAVEVRVAIGGNAYTNTYQKFSFFDVADAAKIVAFGPALIPGGAAGQATSLIVQSKDTADNDRITGGDEFEVLVVSKKGVEVEDVAVEDMETGQYLVTFTPPTADDYTISIEFKGTFKGHPGQIRGGPFSTSFVDGLPDGTNAVNGKLVLHKMRENIGEMSTFANETLSGIRKPVKEGDVDSLLKVKEHLFNKEKREEEMALELETTEYLLKYLQSQNDRSAGVLLNQLKKVQGTWSTVAEDAPAVERQIQPLIKAQRSHSKPDLEEYEKAVETYAEQHKEAGFWKHEVGPDEAERLVSEAERKHAEEKTRFKRMDYLSVMLEMPEEMEKSRELMERVESDLKNVRDLWGVSRECIAFVKSAKDQLWKDVVADELEEQTKALLKKVTGLNRNLRWSDAYKGMNQAMKDFLNTCPLIAALGHSSMRPRHWSMLMEATGKTFTPPHEDDQLKVGTVLDLQLHEFQADVEEITDQAQKEEKMEQGLHKLKEAWDEVEFQTEDFTDEIKLIKLGEEEFEMLENDQLAVQAMLASRYLATFEDEVKYWFQTLGTVAEVMQTVGDIQRTWSYLEPLFIASEEVKKELPETTERFEHIDVSVKEILKNMVSTLKVVPACNQEGLLKRLEDISEQLDMCKKSLKDYLDGKRRLFPRFYFVSEADLLDILSNGSQPTRIMQHITKVFLATDTLEVEQKGDEVVANRWIASVGKEQVDFEDPLPLRGKVEIYLQDVLNAMKSTINANISRCLDLYLQEARTDWLMREGDEEGKPLFPAQVHVLVGAIYYVREVEETFEKVAAGDAKALETYNEKQVEQLNDLIMLTRKKLDKGQRTKVMVMITMDTHSRDVIHRLIRENVTEKTAFQWQSQLKHRYFTERKVAGATIADAAFDYGYEYLGNGPRLVITPLTDRIYVTATQALNLKMGCAPAGPAGTGKTESTKDLASALGKVCYVFNCSPEMDYKSMGNIFKGLAASGAWGCFDEFNRLIPEVLSVCSVQFKAVCDAVRERSETVTIEGDTVSCDWTVGAFITMNPGYLGRSELPEGLKSLFRPITVMVPDLVLICENMLMAEGFKTAKVLASKFYGLYSLLSELLSKQSHYDWGLRAVKSVLVVAGAFLRAEPDMGEEDLLMRALRDMNTPKIVQQDMVVFYGLLGDLFPGINPPRKSDPDLEKNVETACGELKLHPDEYFRLKCVQLDELMVIRHCTFVMGPPGCGKSMCWRNLAKAKGLKNAHVRDLNPKAISTEQLYGYVTMATREWKDGLLSMTMRDLGQIPDTRPKWIILDGDLDANWIESMNSVMDDNKMLTLASNERIPLKPHMKMLFEIRDLRFASPATVSRAGILYIATDKGTQWRAIIAAWVDNLEETSDLVKAVLREQFDIFVPPALEFIRKHVKTLVPLQSMNLVQTLLYMLEGLLNEHSTAGKDKKEVTGNLQPTFVFCAVWAFGSCLSEKDGVDYRKMFSDFWKDEFKQVKFPGRDLVFDTYLDQAGGMKFGTWSSSPYFHTVDFDSATTPMAQVTVPTPETASITYWMDMLVRRQRSVMLVGGAGCGKTQIVRGLMNEFDPNVRTSKTINFHFFMSSDVLRINMEAPLEKKVGNTYGPVGQGHLVFFLDDLNLPEVDPFDTQSAIALVRQHIDYQHWFDPSSFQKGARRITNCQYIASMNPTAGSFFVNPRLQRHFATFAVGFPGSTSLLAIYQTFLDGHLTKRGFNSEVCGLSSALLNAALSLHAKVAQSFRKSAVNFHYEFSLRHLSNVFQGLLTAKPSEFQDPAKFVYLWLHESERVYGDRLVNARDLAKYNGLAQEAAKKKFPQYSVAKYYSGQQPTPLVFCHFVTSMEDKIYDQVENMSDLEKILKESLEEYNETYAAMNLVLFQDAMKHVCRIARIILNPGGHALLVGVGGSGKQSLSRLASFMCGYTTVQITITSTYSINDLKEDLKSMYNKAGLKDEGILFLFTDSQVTKERFLVYINDLLASGDIPDLYAPEEKDEIVNSVVGKVKAAGLNPDRTTCWEFFLNNVRRNLHMALCFSPVGDDFRTRALRFPALVNCTVIDWFQPWPEDALYSVGKRFLADVDLGTEGARAAVEKFMPYSFSSVNDAAAVYLEQERRYCYTTPKSFLELLELFKSLLGRKRSEIGQMIDRLANGLHKLRDTAEAVSKIEEDLKVLLEEAEEKKVKAEGIADSVSKEKAGVEEATAEAAVEADKCAVIAKDVSQQQSQCEEDLAKAEPAVEAAMAALNTLNKKDLGTCKTMSKPPPGVDDVFYAVMVLAANVFLTDFVQKNGKIREADRTWNNAKKALLGNVNGLLDNLLAFKERADNGEVPDVNWKEVRQYLELEHFSKESIEGKNSAAGGLCSWVCNIVTYHDIVVTVEPKRQALAKANEDLNAANTKLEAVKKHVAELEEKLATLTAEFERVNKEKEDAIFQVESGQKRLGLAQRLIKALADENVRWAQSIDELKGEQGVLVGDVLLASAFISYIGPFTKQYRDHLITKKWGPFLATAANGEPLPMGEDANPLLIMTDDAEMAKWQQQGLPADRVSMENGAIVENSKRWPLMIDPQLQGITWVREKEKDNNLQVVRLGQNRLVQKLQVAIENGHSVLIENMGERIDAALMPVIMRATIKRGRKHVLKLGGQEVEFSPDFRLFLHTKLSNPHYPPEIQAECTLCNFTVTESGLEDQLLSLVVKKERPDLAKQKTELIQQQNEFKVRIKELEDLILEKLASAEGDVTQDVELIESLENAKKISNEINEKVVIAKQTTEEINETSELYRPVASRGSLLFFLMNELYKVHTYYIYSLSAFVVVFLRGIDLVHCKEGSSKSAIEDGAEGEGEPGAEGEAGEGEGAGGDGEGGGGEGGEGGNPRVLSKAEVAERCEVLMESITHTVFNYLRRGLFERDKLTIATLLCIRIMVRDGRMGQVHADTLISGPSSTDPGDKGMLSWMPDAVWARVKGLEVVKPHFEKLGDMMMNYIDEWESWFNKEKPEEEKRIPGEWSEPLEPIHKLLLLRAMRPDRLRGALSTFIANAIGEEYVSEPPFDMAKAYDESSPATPIFFVLFPGVDPTVWVEALGHKLGISGANGKFINISMGQGQEAPAMVSLKRFVEEGGWIMLQNVHLMQSWLPELERELELAAEGAHEDFRCFISAEPPPVSHWKNMPESLMQTCIKVANEAPADLKSNLRRSWAAMDEDKVETSKRPAEYKGCLFTLCIYHSLILGRRRFGQQGWSRGYSFNNGDLTVCANVLYQYINDNPDVPWDDLRYIFGEIMYGGHITDPWDRRTNNTYLQVLLTPAIFEGKDIIPGFPSPDASSFTYGDYAKYIEEKLPLETPQLFGMHPNAEIGYLTASATNMFDTILSLTGGIGGGSGGGDGEEGVVKDKDTIVRETIEELQERLPENFNMIELQEKAEDRLKGESAPYVVVVLQECTRMNTLLSEIRRTLKELRMGMNGELNMSDSMEDLFAALAIFQVPGRNPFHKCSWEAVAWWSKKSLMPWFEDMLRRIEQLQSWSDDLVMPVIMWLPGLFNPTAFLTAIMQVTARHQSLPLDRMTVETQVTSIWNPESVQSEPESGAYMHGLFMEGARWSTEDDGCLVDAKLKELLSPLPVVHVKAVEVQPHWIPSSVGYLRKDPGLYESPVYQTTLRGPTFVFLATMRTQEPVEKWVLAGAAVIMQEDD